MFSGLIGIFFLLFITITFASIIKGAPFVWTDKKTIKDILKLSAVQKGHTFIDLGSGDGRILAAAAKKGAYVTGYEINPILVFISVSILKLQGLSKSSKVVWGSLWNADLSKYKIINVFGISYIMNDLETKIVNEAKKGTRIISQAYAFSGLKPVKKMGSLFLYKI